ncbi:MAG TPA: hypothetical protein RMH99_08265, partial [Sandaracinaceae bacterium LLY-WYZ-13_1]|nr:hypothetical protein [Sandaracinaceae bacterium LLY-WYZ-13_1]
GYLAFGLSEGDGAVPTAAGSVAPSAPSVPAPAPSPTPSAPAVPRPAPPPFPPSSGPAAPSLPPDGPPTPVAIADDADPCAVPVTHHVDCDRDFDEFEPQSCEIRRGRELHLIAAYEPGSPDGVVNVDVARTAAPLVLVLSSYGDTTWRLRLAEGVELEEVLLVGRGRSEVEDPPDGVRVRSRTSRSLSGRFPIMGWSWHGMSESWSGRRTAEAAEAETRLAMRAYVGCYEPTRFVLGQQAP